MVRRLVGITRTFQKDLRYKSSREKTKFSLNISILQISERKIRRIYRRCNVTIKPRRFSRRKTKNIWRSMSTEEKEKYHRLAKEKDNIKSKTSKKVKRFSVNETQENVRDIGEWSEYLYKGLQNKCNDCWLNSMLQCINHLTIRNTIIESSDKDISPLVSALIVAMKKMEKHKA